MRILIVSSDKCWIVLDKEILIFGLGCGQYHCKVQIKTIRPIKRWRSTLRFCIRRTLAWCDEHHFVIDHVCLCVWHCRAITADSTEWLISTELESWTNISRLDLGDLHQLENCICRYGYVWLTVRFFASRDIYAGIDEHFLHKTSMGWFFHYHFPGGLSKRLHHWSK